MLVTAPFMIFWGYLIDKEYPWIWAKANNFGTGHEKKVAGEFVLFGQNFGTDACSKRPVVGVVRSDQRYSKPSRLQATDAKT